MNSKNQIFFFYQSCLSVGQGTKRRTVHGLAAHAMGHMGTWDDCFSVIFCGRYSSVLETHRSTWAYEHYANNHRMKSHHVPPNRVIVE